MHKAKKRKKSVQKFRAEDQNKNEVTSDDSETEETGEEQAEEEEETVTSSSSGGFTILRVTLRHIQTVTSNHSHIDLKSSHFLSSCNVTLVM